MVLFGTTYLRIVLRIQREIYIKNNKHAIETTYDEEVRFELTVLIALERNEFSDFNFSVIQLIYFSIFA